ncbi:hypothetical protein KZ483_21235 [Paenibacillus sp. sptzw28]|uniref:hypothetical protein n=1 Tax=Paenibacillus sp. sptzw28 TaxID=715179 RepID=UPI001C6ED5B8|nr:hypothetical protein [Paenibacillus sp. sptzw28]QYR20321.1 hypothetical protein KZ483_21235 [Paenibacillus sp. sptzw28]
MKKNRKKANVKQAMFPLGGNSQEMFTPAEQAAPPFINQGVPGIFGSQTSVPAPSNWLGGLDGFISSMGKIQKLFGIFQQITPMFKLFGSLMGPKATITSVSGKKRRTRAGKTHKSRTSAASRRVSK